MERAEMWPLSTAPGWCEWQKGDARALEYGHCRWCGSTLTRWVDRPARLVAGELDADLVHFALASARRRQERAQLRTRSRFTVA